MCPSGAANACLLAGSRSGDGWKQASDRPWSQDRDAGRADGAWQVRPVAWSSVATRGGRIAARWPAPTRRSRPWGCGRRMASGAPRLGNAPNVPSGVRGTWGRVRRRAVGRRSWRGRPVPPVSPARGAVANAWRVAAGAPFTPWRAVRRWPARPRPGAARRPPRPSNHGVQLTPLARFLGLGAILVPSGAANAESLGGFPTLGGRPADGGRRIDPARVACPLR